MLNNNVQEVSFVHPGELWASKSAGAHSTESKDLSTSLSGPVEKSLTESLNISGCKR